VPDKELSAKYPTDLPSWQALKTHYRDKMKSALLGELFRQDRLRFTGYSVEAGDLFLDYSKNFVDDETRKLLVQLATEAGVREAIDAMFAGDEINVTEGRPALHVALRSKLSDQVALDVAGVSDTWQTLEQMTQFVSAVQQGLIRGHTGRRLTEIVNIGIGGSDLGTVMASRALRHYWQPGMNFHSVSNIDGTQLVDLTEKLDPEETLFVICSKTFTTQETMSNANAAAQWITDSVGTDALNAHFAAASTNHEAMDVFGINPHQPLLDLVGHRPVFGVGHRHGAFPGIAGRRPAHGSAFPDRVAGSEHAGNTGLACRVEPQLLRCRKPGHPPVRQPAGAVSSVSAAAAHGEQRQTGFQRFCSSCTWRATANACGSMANASRQQPARSSGASPARTHNIRSTSCCTRERTSYRSISYCRPGHRAAGPLNRTSPSPIASHKAKH
jgi:hypothetical protein